jgi:hypothetical protein
MILDIITRDKMKVFIFLTLLMSYVGIVHPQRLEIQFFNAQNKLVFRLEQDDFEIWRDPEYLALRIDKRKVQEISHLDDSLINGVCRIVNHKGEAVSIKIIDSNMSLKTEKCIYIWADENGLSMLAGVIVIGSVGEDGCKGEVDKLASFLNAH